MHPESFRGKQRSQSGGSRDLAEEGTHVDVMMDSTGTHHGVQMWAGRRRARLSRVKFTTKDTKITKNL